LKRPGYTLLEMMLVLALIVLLAAMAYPSIDSMYADLKVQAAADEVRAQFVQARTQAVNEGRPYRFSVVPNGDRCRISPLGGSALAGESDEPAVERSILAVRTLPKGITFRMGENSQGAGGDGEGFTTVAVFLPDGTAQEDCDIILSARDARPLVLKLRALTGGVTVDTAANVRGLP
jgi:prepilin-type N-terminal cleavage/methylation domain-containing protein